MQAASDEQPVFILFVLYFSMVHMAALKTVIPTIMHAVVMRQEGQDELP